MLPHLEQNEREEDARFSDGVSRFRTALYSLHTVRVVGNVRWRLIPDVFFSFDFEGLVEASEVDGSAWSSYFAANGAETELSGVQRCSRQFLNLTWYGTAELDSTVKRTAPQ